MQALNEIKDENGLAHSLREHGQMICGPIYLLVLPD